VSEMIGPSVQGSWFWSFVLAKAIYDCNLTTMKSQCRDEDIEAI